jgi:hypothetical protein
MPPKSSAMRPDEMCEFQIRIRPVPSTTVPTTSSVESSGGAPVPSISVRSVSLTPTTAGA